MITEENPKRKRSLGHPRFRWEHTVRRDLESLNRDSGWKARTAWNVKVL